MTIHIHIHEHTEQSIQLQEYVHEQRLEQELLWFLTNEVHGRGWGAHALSLVADESEIRTMSALRRLEKLGLVVAIKNTSGDLTWSAARSGPAEVAPGKPFLG